MSTKPLDFDVSCFSCGYNLRGLAGDPIRCPECGSENPVSVIDVTDEQVVAQLRKLETPATVCLVLSAVTLASLFAAIELRHVGCLLPVLVPVLFVWPALAREFQDSCRNHPRWFALLMRYQVCGFACLVTPAVLVWVIAALAENLSNSLGIEGEFGRGMVQLAGVVGLVAFLSVFIRRVYRYATGEMRAIQRTVAREMALRALRTRVLRQFRTADSVNVGHNGIGAIHGDRDSSTQEAR